MGACTRTKIYMGADAARSNGRSKVSDALERFAVLARAGCVPRRCSSSFVMERSAEDFDVVRSGCVRVSIDPVGGNPLALMGQECLYFSVKMRVDAFDVINDFSFEQQQRCRSMPIESLVLEKKRVACGDDAFDRE